MPSVLFTGGGTAGHVTPNIALLEAAAGRNWEVAYVGSVAGIEREMIGALGIPYYAIASVSSGDISPGKISLILFSSSGACCKA